MTQAELMDILDYNPKTGNFVWKLSMGKKVHAGDRAGTIDDKGYIVIRARRKAHKAHRLAWLFVYGSLPPGLDHKNRVRCDNRIDNLRIATPSQNAANRKCRSGGLKGACFTKGRWQAGATKNGRSVYGGRYDSEIEAHMAYTDLARKLHGEYAHH